MSPGRLLEAVSCTPEADERQYCEPQNGDADGSGRIDSIQYLRALAALSVAASHSVGDVAYHGGPNLLRHYYTGAAGVDLFFVISGFVMVYTTRDRFGTPGSAAEFMRKRLIRIVPLYWVSTAAYCLVQIGQGKWSVVRPEFVASSLVFWPYADAAGPHLPVYSIGWTLNFEMFFYVVFAFGLLYRRLGLPLVCGSLLGLVALGAVTELPEPLGFWAHPILIDFLLGVGLGLLYLRGWRLSSRTGMMVCLLALALLVGGALGGFNSIPDIPESFPRWIAWGIPCALFCAGTVLCEPSPARPRPWLLRLGAASYALYLVHALVIIGTRPLLPVLKTVVPGHDAVAGWLSVTLTLALAVAVAMIIHVGFERPVDRLLRRRTVVAPSLRPDCVLEQDRHRVYTRG